MQVKKIKDWLKEQSEKPQFDVIAGFDGTITEVQRIKDGLKFCIGISPKNSDFCIAKFHEDEIYVSYIWMNIKYKLKINDIPQDYAYNYGWETGRANP